MIAEDADSEREKNEQAPGSHMHPQPGEELRLRQEGLAVMFETQQVMACHNLYFTQFCSLYPYHSGLFSVKRLAG